MDKNSRCDLILESSLDLLFVTTLSGKGDVQPSAISLDILLKSKHTQLLND